MRTHHLTHTNQHRPDFCAPVFPLVGVSIWNVRSYAWPAQLVLEQSPAESDMRRAAQSQAGQFGEISIAPFRGKRRARDSVLSGSVDELYLASERAATRSHLRLLCIYLFISLSFVSYSVILRIKPGQRSAGLLCR